MSNINKSIIWLCGICTLIVGIIYLAPISFIDPLTAEDGPVENFSAFLYFLTSLLCVCLLIRKQKRGRVFLIIWAMCCFIFMGEETSWFQRIFDYSIPKIEQANKQNEFNLHNLNIFMGGSTKELIKDIFLKGEINNVVKLIFHSQNLFRIGFYTYFLLFPILLFWIPFNNLMAKLDFPKPHIKLIVSILVFMNLLLLLELTTTGVEKWALVETSEMFYAIFILFYVWTHLKGDLTNEKA